MPEHQAEQPLPAQLSPAAPPQPQAQQQLAEQLPAPQPQLQQPQAQQPQAPQPQAEQLPAPQFPAQQLPAQQPESQPQPTAPSLPEQPATPAQAPAAPQLPPQTSYEPYVPPQAPAQNGNGAGHDLGPATLPHLLSIQSPPVPQFIPVQPQPEQPAADFQHPQEPALPESAPDSEQEPDSPAQPRRRRATKRRLPTQKIFSDLATQAAIPPAAYAIGEDVDGAMCLVRTDEGFEVFNSAAGARHEVRVFQDEESAYFYLFGVLVADAVRTGALAPRD